MALERGQNRMLGARAGVAGANLLPQPRDEDDVRVEAQWQEHVCRSNLVSGVFARVEGRGAESLPFGAGAHGAVLSCCFDTNVLLETTKTPSGRQCPGGIP